jgi:hypothetical protein
VQRALRPREYEKDGVKHRVVELDADRIGKLDRAVRREEGEPHGEGLELFGSLVADWAPDLPPFPGTTIHPARGTVRMVAGPPLKSTGFGGRFRF